MKDAEGLLENYTKIVEDQKVKIKDIETKIKTKTEDNTFLRV